MIKSTMKKLAFSVAVSLVGCVLVAMPNKQEIAKTRPLVSEIMAPMLAEYKAKTKNAVEVADAAKGFSETAKGEATKYLLLKGAVNYYIKGNDFDKAISTVEDIKAKVKDVPPAEIVDIISKSLDNNALSKSPRLQSLLQFTMAQAQAVTDVKKLSAEMKRFCTDPIRRKYAEAIALTSGWRSAIPELAKVYGNIGEMAKADANGGSADSMILGDFWWKYKASYPGMEGVFRGRAVAYYRKAIAEGKVDGLKISLVNQRLASFAQQDVYSAVADFSLKDDVALSLFAAKNTSGIFARWSFDENLKDSIGGIMPVKSEKAQLANGAVTLQPGFPMEFSAGSVPFAPFTVQLWATIQKDGDKRKDDDKSEDMVVRIAPTADYRDERIFLRASHRFKYWNIWFQGFCAFKSYSKLSANESYYDGKRRLFTITGENTQKGMVVNFYQNGKFRKSLTTHATWSSPPMLILGGSTKITYSEVRVYIRALTPDEIVESYRLGPDRLPSAERK